ncbi:MAG TPA: glycosyltransferase family 4 protein [Acetobacteraceae bacterium]|nr:glycosyltransferase family 4 protein [Acetobacteraceae bacterium]
MSALETVAAIAKAGGTALVASGGGRLVPRIAELGGRHILLPLDTRSPLAIWRNAAHLAALIRAEHVDLLHAHSRAVAWSALFAARRAGLPFVTTWHGAYGEGSPLKRRYNGVMASGDRVVAVSRFIAARIAARHHLAPPRLRVVPPGVDPARFDPAAVSPARAGALARTWGLPEGRPVIMLPARFARWKGQGVLLAALAHLADHDAVAVLVGPLAGRGRYVAALRSQAAALGLADRVFFPGGTDDMPAALALAAVVVNPSTEPEAFGRVVIEAQAMARPVIVADHGAAPETVREGETGWRVKPGDEAALTAALDQAFSLPPAARAAVGERARAVVIGSYSLAAMQEAMLAIYRELLAAPYPVPGPVAGPIPASR